MQRNGTNLELLLLRGPAGGNAEEGLNELRYTILTQGIPANSEGMVRRWRSIQGARQLSNMSTLSLTSTTVGAAHVYLAHLAQRPAPPHRRLP
jgi:hypothetical protein